MQNLNNMILDENNKQKYPSMNTGVTDTSLKCKFFISTLFFALIMWCSPCQSCYAQTSDSVDLARFDKETADYFLDLFEEWSKREIDNKQKIQRSSLWETYTQHIVGSVVDATNNKPIENAKLELLRKDDSSFVCSTTTNSEGKYGLSFPQLTHNDGSLVLFMLRITADGYQSLCIGVDMSMIIERQSIYPPIPSIFPLKPIDKEVPYKKTKGTEQRR